MQAASATGKPVTGFGVHNLSVQKALILPMLLYTRSPLPDGRTDVEA